jgi:hypothetical protein
MCCGASISSLQPSLYSSCLLNVQSIGSVSFGGNKTVGRSELAVDSTTFRCDESKRTSDDATHGTGGNAADQVAYTGEQQSTSARTSMAISLAVAVFVHSHVFGVFLLTLRQGEKEAHGSRDDPRRAARGGNSTQRTLEEY